MICNECETVAHCSKYGCIPKHPAQLPFGVKGGLVAIKTLLSRDPRVHANTAIQMIDALLANEALDKMAKNARELGLAEQPAQQEPVKWSSYEPDGTHHNKPAQSKQKPMAWLKAIDTPGGWGKFVEAKPNEKGARPVYTSPQAQRTWVGLTDEELMYMYNEPRSDAEMIAFGREVEAKLKEKNA